MMQYEIYVMQDDDYWSCEDRGPVDGVRDVWRLFGILWDLLVDNGPQERIKLEVGTDIW